MKKRWWWFMDQHDVFMQLRRRLHRDYQREQLQAYHRRHARRDPWQLREKAAIILWRRHGYSISHLARVFHRSSSSIYDVLRKAETMGVLLKRDYRKLPNPLRRRTNAVSRSMMESYMKKWLRWIAGEGDKPP